MSDNIHHVEYIVTGYEKILATGYFNGVNLILKKNIFYSRMLFIDINIISDQITNEMFIKLDTYVYFQVLNVHISQCKF